ncbi:MAG: PilZ domain-containing protein [Deltaproteobacteria bacterium]|nr:PilZ domain-containing protein [Deltaproteobacteria bacterium]
MFGKRRSHAREAVTRDCTIECPSSQWSCRGMITNISEGGAGLVLEETPPTRNEIVLSMLDERGRELTRKGRVMWFINRTPPEEGATIGLKFV